jgi:4-alpha-glucanotransferase
MKQVKEHASSKNVFIKGDIPILVSRFSADVEAEPKLFDLLYDAGAPPDFYNQEGQHWGFPLMNWDAMRAGQFEWWKRRLRVAEEFFHIYRIDHVVGLFRIWGIPKGEKPINGHYVPTDHTLWQPQGQQILEMMIDATNMLPIAEDLGTVPAEVTFLLNELGICGTRVIRWKRRWGGNLDYIPYEEYDPYSLTTISTHDSEPLVVWWKNQPEEAALYAKFKHWEYTPDLSVQGRIEILKDSHKTPTYFHVNPLQEYLTLFPEFCWEKPEDERINIPGTLLPENWTYRFRPYVEEIIAHKPLADLFAQLVVESST